MLKYLILLLTLPCTIHGQNQFEFTDTVMNKFSHTQFTWWGFDIYKAELWTEKGRAFDLKSKTILHITYQKNIKAEKLISTTMDEWKRLKIVNKKSQQWLVQLRKIWPDIKNGDSLTTFLNKDVTEFYRKNQLLGKIEDKEFGPAFLNIWLHKNSQTKELRKRTP